MKRNFYLMYETLRPFLILQSKPLIDTIFPDSDIKDHLVDKLDYQRNLCKSSSSPIALFNFYTSLDAELQIQFDLWFNREMDSTDNKTIQHNISLVTKMLFINVD